MFEIFISFMVMFFLMDNIGLRQTLLALVLTATYAVVALLVSVKETK